MAEFTYTSKQNQPKKPETDTKNLASIKTANLLK